MTIDHGGVLHRRHAPGSDSAPPADDRRRRLALAVVCLCAFTTAIDITITNVALPFIAVRALRARTPAAVTNGTEDLRG